MNITHVHAKCTCKFHDCFSANSTQTAAAAAAAAAGNVNEKHITSSAPDDIFQETPTQVVENSRGKRFHE